MAGLVQSEPNHYIESLAVADPMIHDRARVDADVGKAWLVMSDVRTMVIFAGADSTAAPVDTTLVTLGVEILTAYDIVLSVVNLTTGLVATNLFAPNITNELAITQLQLGHTLIGNTFLALILKNPA